MHRVPMDWSTFMGWGISPLRPGIARTQNLAVILSEVAAPRAAHESKDLHFAASIYSMNIGVPNQLADGRSICSTTNVSTGSFAGTN